MFTGNQDLAFNPKDCILELKQDRMRGQVTDPATSLLRTGASSLSVPPRTAGRDRIICGCLMMAYLGSFFPSKMKAHGCRFERTQMPKHKIASRVALSFLELQTKEVFRPQARESERSVARLFWVMCLTLLNWKSEWVYQLKVRRRNVNWQNPLFSDFKKRLLSC